MHNMAHAVTAYLGYFKGITYIWEAIQNEVIKSIVRMALYEACEALHLAHKVFIAELKEYANELIRRFENKALGDTVHRVGKDPIRKLSDKDRLVGAANLCIKQGNYPVFICIGIAAAYHFALPEDEAAMTIQQSIRANGIGNTIYQISAIQKDSKLSMSIERFFVMLKKQKSLNEIVVKAKQIASKELKRELR